MAESGQALTPGSGVVGASGERPDPEIGRHVHLLIVGPHGVGTSSAGFLVAERLQRPFVDTDSLLALHYGHRADDPSTQLDPADLHAAELDVVRRVLVMPQSVVLAVPASVIAPAGGADRLADTEVVDVRVIWLDADDALLAARGGDHPPDLLAAARRRARSLADAWVDAGDLPIDAVADEVVAAWRLLTHQR